MADKIDEKIINIFARHKKQYPDLCDEKIVRCENGYYYVCLKKDDHDHYFNSEKILQQRKHWYYIVKVMIETNDNPIIHNYKVAGDKINEFLALYLTNQREGIIVEIDKYGYDEPA
ncbi:MAG: hypothetical protein WCK67_10525 [bacterium]